jgi:hypothetical protein
VVSAASPHGPVVRIFKETFCVSRASRKRGAHGRRAASQVESCPALIHIEGWHYTIKDNTGQEFSFAVTAITKLLSTIKEGDYVVAMIGDENTATSIKNLKQK